MSTWLQHHDLCVYREAFSRAGVGLDMLALLGDEELRQMGILTLGPRRRILAAIQAAQVGLGGYHEACDTLVQRPCIR